MKPRSFLSLFTVASLSLTAPALAAPARARAEPASVRESLTGEAAAHFDEGTRSYKASAFAAAREAFLAAHARSGDPRILYNVAVCDKAIGRYARALRTLKSSAAEPERPLPEAHARRVAEAIGALSRYVAFVTVETIPGASIAVDGEIVLDDPIPLDPGKHTVTAAKDGYEDASETLLVEAGSRQRVALPLLRSATATIACVGADGCEVHVDGERVGRAPITVTRGAGLHLVEAFVGERPFADRRVEFRSGLALSVMLAPRAAAMARLRVTTEHPDDVVTIDGDRTARGGIDVRLPVGEHRVTIDRRGGPSKTFELLLRENETRDLHESVAREGGGPSPWWFIGGGAIAAGAAAVAVFLATRPTRFEGSTAGTLNPFVVPAWSDGGRR